MRLFLSMLSMNGFKQAGLARQVVLSLRPEDIFRWPILSYLRQGSSKKEIVSLLFEFVKTYQETKPEVDVAKMIGSPIMLKRFENWVKVEASSTGRFDYAVPVQEEEI